MSITNRLFKNTHFYLAIKTKLFERGYKTPTRKSGTKRRAQNERCINRARYDNTTNLWALQSVSYERKVENIAYDLALVEEQEQKWKIVKQKHLKCVVKNVLYFCHKWIKYTVKMETLLICRLLLLRANNVKRPLLFYSVRSKYGIFHASICNSTDLKWFILEFPNGKFAFSLFENINLLQQNDEPPDYFALTKYLMHSQYKYAQRERAAGKMSAHFPDFSFHLWPSDSDN